MDAQSHEARAGVIPCLLYRDAAAMIDWLCLAFGFSKGLVVRNEDGGVQHAELHFGGGMIMVGTVNSESDYGRLIRQPAQLGGQETQSPYLVVADADDAHARVKEAGAEIVLPLSEPPYGGKHFTCRDPEGHLWSVGSYDPWRIDNPH